MGGGVLQRCAFSTERHFDGIFVLSANRMFCVPWRLLFILVLPAPLKQKVTGRHPRPARVLIVIRPRAPFGLGYLHNGDRGRAVVFFGLGGCSSSFKQVIKRKTSIIVVAAVVTTASAPLCACRWGGSCGWISTPSSIAVGNQRFDAGFCTSVVIIVAATAATTTPVVFHFFVSASRSCGSCRRRLRSSFRCRPLQFECKVSLPGALCNSSL